MTIIKTTMPIITILVISFLVSIGVIYEPLFGPSVKNPIEVPETIRAIATTATPQQLGRTRFNGILLSETSLQSPTAGESSRYQLYVTEDLNMLCATAKTVPGQGTNYAITAQRWSNYNAQRRFCSFNDSVAVALIAGLDPEIGDTLYLPASPNTLSASQRPIEVYLALKSLTIILLTLFIAAAALGVMMVLSLVIHFAGKASGVKEAS